MIYSYKNFINQNPQLQDGDVLENCNLAQNVVTTFDGQGAENVTVVDCNCINCQFPESWDIQGGNRAQISFCYHLHPDMDLPEEPENCPHVTYIDEVQVDGSTIDTVYTRGDTVL